MDDEVGALAVGLSIASLVFKSLRRAEPTKRAVYL